MSHLEFKQLTADNRTQLNKLIHNIEDSLDNKSFWLPIDAISRTHFLDNDWTIFNGCFFNGYLVAASGLFLNPHEYYESAKQLKIENRNIAELGRLMVSPECRGSYLSFYTSRTLIDIAKQKGIDYIIATVHPDNIPSKKTLEKLGFEKSGYILKQENYQRDIYLRII